MVWYSDRKIIRIVDNWIFGELFNTARVLDVGGFDNALTNLAVRLKTQVVGGDLFRKLAFERVTFGRDSVTIYEMMQCTPYLSNEQCNLCLYG
ncbi:putative Gnk2-like domain-containing protein [Helianthus anomalus]